MGGLAAALLLAAGCAHHGPAPATPAAPPATLPATPPPRDTTQAAVPLYYHALLDSLGEIPAGALRGRVIVLDPGHGGRYTGAIGVGGLRESDVNLGVARALRELLVAAGARVVMTHMINAETRVGAGFTLHDDLERRAAIADSLDADLFLSIHHNSSLPLDRKRATTDIYFQLNDDGPSLDAARYLHRYLVRNLGLPPGTFSAANYLVLREAHVPAVLSEASFLSNPAIESALATPEGVRLEAEAYFLGIGHYFAAGIPVLHLTSVGDEGGPQRPARGSPGIELGPEPVFIFTARDSAPVRAPLAGAALGIDSGSARAALDGEAARADYTGGARFWVRPTRALAAGRHHLELSVRNLAGNSSRPLELDFGVTSPAATLSLTAFPGALPTRGEAAAGVRVTVLDRLGNPVADGTRLTVQVTGGRLLDRSAATSGGHATLHVSSLPGTRPVRVMVAVPAGGGPRSTITLGRRARGAALLWGVARDSRSGAPVAGASLEGLFRAGEPAAPAFTDSAGYYFVELPPGRWKGQLFAAGYQTCDLADPALSGAVARRVDLPVEALAAGHLLGICVVLDPAGGGDDQGGVSAAGIRGKDLSLGIARELAGRLSRAGARVVMTREDDSGRSEVDRIRIAERAHPDLLVRIECDAARDTSLFATAGHYPGSQAGEALADSVGASLALLGEGAVDTAEVAVFSVQQASSPALGLFFHVLNNRHEFDLAWNPVLARRLAGAILAGIEAQRGVPPEDREGVSRARPHR